MGIALSSGKGAKVGNWGQSGKKKADPLVSGTALIVGKSERIISS
jgi:hypothetical protein